MLREKSKWKPHEDESTNAERSGGPTRSSVEIFVLEMERRGWLIRLYNLVNQKWEEPLNKAMPMSAKPSTGWEEPYESTQCERRAYLTDIPIYVIGNECALS
jgi:hypothetical protein